MNGSCFQPAFEVVPFIPVENDPIVWYGDIVAVNGVGVEVFCFSRPGLQVNNELVAIQIEIHPGIRAAAFFAAEDIPIKDSCFL